MKWKKYTIETTTAAEDFVSSLLADLGIEGVEIEDNVPLSERDTSKMFIDFLPELPPDEGVGYVSFYLDADASHERELEAVRAGLEELRAYTDVGSGAITESETEDEDWINNWKEFFHPFSIRAQDREGRERSILIKPTWEDAGDRAPDQICAEIDPGISFGTGKHETTQLCIRQLLKYLKDGDEVLDVGCGSGILSIVSLKLGAAYVAGTDIDEACITSARENFAVNRLPEERGDFYAGNLINDMDLQEKVGTGRYDIAAANILADVIIPMAPVIRERLKPGGIFITSGIIDFKETDVREALERAGLEVLETTRQGEWVCITARR